MLSYITIVTTVTGSYALPYKVKVCETVEKEEGQEEPFTMTMLFAAGQLGRPETPV